MTNLNETVLLSIILSWNRPKLLETTILSYCKTVSVPHRLIVVDNNSDKETIATIKRLQKQYNFYTVLLDKNIGGKAFNYVLENENAANYQFIHFSENDVEYLPGWDNELIAKFEAFPELGQLSPYSPYPEVSKGEVWKKRIGKKATRNQQTIHFTRSVTTTCVIRSKIIEQGVKWRVPRRKDWLFPRDRNYSNQIKRHGWKVAWNDRYVATNWGHNVSSYQYDPEYYANNYDNKKLKVSGFQRRLKKNGYKLVQNEEGSYEIKRIIE